MKKDTTKNSQRASLRLVSDTPSENKDALSPFGPLRAGLITSQPTRNQQLTELLSCLEKEVETLQFKYLEACDTLIQDIVTVRAKLITGIKDITGIDVLE